MKSRVYFCGFWYTIYAKTWSTSIAFYAYFEKPQLIKKMCSKNWLQTVCIPCSSSSSTTYRHRTTLKEINGDLIEKEKNSFWNLISFVLH